MVTLALILAVIGALMALIMILMNLNDSPGWVTVGCMLLALNCFLVYVNVNKLNAVAQVTPAAPIIIYVTGDKPNAP